MFTQKSVLIMGQGLADFISPKCQTAGQLAVTDLNKKLAARYATLTYHLPTTDARTMDYTARFPNGFDVVIPCLLEGDVNAAVDAAAMVVALSCMAAGSHQAF